MDRPTLDERLPALYREILAVATELERRGRRPEALRLRRRAAGDYRSWDERAERRLLLLLEDARDRLHPDAQGDGLGRRMRSRLRRVVAARSGSIPEPSA